MTEKRSGTEMPFGRCVPPEAREHFHAAREELRQSFEALFPPGFVEHRRKARKEILLAWRSIIDAALENMEKSQGKV
ncbi:MAG: hypothetical protein ACOY16_02320 [Chloroflexota bacterium]